MPFKTKAFKCISLVLFVLVFINTSQAQKIKIDGVGVVVGKNIVLDSDIEKFKLELENSSEGKIKINNLEIKDNLREWQKSIGYVSQKVYLIDDTIEKNILLSGFKLPSL